MQVEKKEDRIPESHQPQTKPSILFEVHRNCEKFETYENIVFRIEIVELEDSLKMIGLSHKGYTIPFSNIKAYHERYSAQVSNKTQPHTDIAMFTDLPDGTSKNYIFGEQVDTLDEIPEGLIGIDTFTKKFAVIHFGAQTRYKLLGDQDPGEAMVSAGRYINQVWLPRHRDIAITDDKGNCGWTNRNGRLYETGLIEVYPVNIEISNEMCFYIPLHEGV